MGIVSARDYNPSVGRLGPQVHSRFAKVRERILGCPRLPQRVDNAQPSRKQQPPSASMCLPNHAGRAEETTLSYKPLFQANPRSALTKLPFTLGMGCTVLCSASA